MNEQKRRVGVLGGDARQRALVQAMSEAGWTVWCWGLGEGWCVPPSVVACDDWQTVTEECEVLLLPLPMTQDGIRVACPLETAGEGLRLSNLFSACRGKRVFAGRVGEAVARLAEKHEVCLFDYYENEALQLRNALPTVEGALAIALQELSVTLFGSEVSVIGYGRIASLLAERLVALGARVTVYARKERDRLHAALRGMTGAPLTVGTEGAEGKVWTPACRVIFNTVPQRVLSEHHLRLLPPDCLVMDLASAPGGVELSAAERCGVRCIWATALPGRCFPESAGRILAETLGELLEKEGITQC